MYVCIQYMYICLYSIINVFWHFFLQSGISFDFPMGCGPRNRCETAPWPISPRRHTLNSSRGDGEWWWPWGALTDCYWLVVSTPLKSISQLGWLFPIYGKIKNVPNHQPVLLYPHYSFIIDLHSMSSKVSKVSKTMPKWRWFRFLRCQSPRRATASAAITSDRCVAVIRIQYIYNHL